MKIKRNSLILGMLVFLISVNSSEHITRNRQKAKNNSEKIMSIEEIRPGQIGIARTVFKGNKIENLKVKVLGVLKNALNFNQDLIVVKFYHPITKKAAIIAGMSGTPIYIKGKLIGAFAYGNDFAKEPIGYVVPIKYILELKNKKGKGFGINPGLTKPLLLTSKGIHQKALELVLKSNDSLFNLFSTSMPISVISGTSKSKNSFSFNFSNIQSGSMVGAKLIQGDFELAAFGTVVLKEGKNLYLFGHPFLSLMDVEYPLIEARVLGVYPSYQESYKIVTGGKLIGTVVYDGFNGLLAKLEQKPKLVPLNIEINNQNFHMELARHNQLTSQLLMLALINTIMYKLPSADTITIKLKENLKIKNYYRNIKTTKIFSGDIRSVLTSLFWDLSWFHNQIINNDFFETEIEKADFKIKIIPHRKEYRLINLSILKKEKEKNRIKIYLKLVFREYNKGKILKNLILVLPTKNFIGPLKIEISNQLLEKLNFFVAFFFPISFQNSLLDIKFEDFINKLETREGFYLKISSDSIKDYRFLYQILIKYEDKILKRVNSIDPEKKIIFEINLGTPTKIYGNEKLIIESQK